MKRLALLLFVGATLMARADLVKHNYDLKHVLWKLTLTTDMRSIKGDATNTVTLTEDSATVELQCSELTVSKVWVDGKPAQFTNANDKLTVTLPTLGKAGQTLHIRCVYSGEPVNGIYFTTAEHAYPAHTPIVYTQGEGEDNHFWLPTYDLPDDKATSESYVTVPKDWTAVANGILEGVATKGGTRTFHWNMKQPHSTYLISLVAGPLVKADDKWKGKPVDYYVPPRLEAEGKASFASTPKMIAFYSKITGVDYPYDKFAQEAVPDFMFGGMENVTAVTQTARTLHRKETEPINDSTYLVAHELAHQWFGDLITCRTWEHSWLNEGFATTLPVFLNREWHGQDYFDMDRYRNFEGAVDTIGSRGRKDVPGDVGSVATVTMGSVYDGGCSRIMMLYHMMGEETFWKAINAFLVKYSFQPATTDDFFIVMHDVSGQDYSSFVKQWYHTSSTPSLTAKLDGKSLVITQLQPYYSLDLPVWIWNDGAWDKKTIAVRAAESRLDLGELAGKPMLIDPEVWTPMELKYDIKFSPQDVALVYAHAPNVAQKARIINFLFDTIPTAQRIGIGHTETFQGLLAMIANHIPQEGSSYLFELSRNQDERVVNAAVIAMGKLQKDDAMAARLADIAKNDSNEMVREHATQSLLNWETDPAMARKVWTKGSFDDGYRTMALDWFGAHAPDEAREKCLAFITHSDSEVVRWKAAQVLGIVKEKPGEHRVYDALVAIANETSYRTRVAAIASLGQLGNKQAITVLTRFIAHGPGGVRGTTQAAVDQLKKN
jgi:aminopeptidase N